MKPLEEYIDDKNRSLFQKLTENYQIDLIKIDPEEGQNEDHWKLNYFQNTYRISYYKDVESSGFLSHELFHIDLLVKGFSDFPEILPLIKEGNKNYIFLPIVGHLNNVLAHERFYNDFIKLGYLPCEFVSDYNSPINIQEIIETIETAKQTSGLPHADISAFIQYFFAAKDNRNPLKEKEYEKLLSYLKSRNSKLFSILNNTWVSWANSKSLASKDFLNHLFTQTESLLDKTN